MRKKNTKCLQIKQHLIQGIRLHHFKGALPSENQLAKRFTVSRMTARRALTELENEGYVECEQNKGCSVKKISRDKIEEILDLVSLLEGHAAELLASRRVEKKDISYLKSLQAEMEGYAKKNDYFLYIRKNREFHDFFPKKCGNQTLYETVSNLRDRVHIRTRYLGIAVSRHFDIYWKDHRKMIEAISEQNPSKARKATVHHIQRSKRFLLEALDFLGLTESI